jgi:hypothetical protein
MWRYKKEVLPVRRYFCTTVHRVVFNNKVVSNVHVFREYTAMRLENLKALKCR